MARINPDPYVGSHLFALVHRVTCLIDTEESLKTMVQALEEDGVAPDDIDVFSGEQGALCLDLPGRTHGMACRVLRMLEATVGNEGEAHHRIHEALCQGSILLCVKVNKRKRQLERDRAVRVLKQLQAHEIHYWGPWAFEDVISS